MLHRLRTNLLALLDYFSCSPLSRPRQLEALRELDRSLLRDVGIDEAVARRAAIAPWE